MSVNHRARIHVTQTAQPNFKMAIYVFRNNQVEGPFDELIVEQAIANGSMSSEDLCCPVGQTEWIAACTLFQSKAAIRPPAPAGLGSAPTSNNDRKNLVSQSVTKTGHEPPKQFQWKTAKIPLILAASVVAVVGFLVVAVLFILASGGGSVAPTSPQRIEQQLSRNLAVSLDRNKQALFDKIHPTGTANSIEVHDVQIAAWKHGQNTNRIADIQQVVVRYTIHWSGPITKDGYTKLTQSFDLESNMVGKAEIIQTNGYTNSDIGAFSANFLSGWLQYEAQREGSEEATRKYYNGQ